MSVETAVQEEIDRLPADLRDSGLAAGVLAMARELDVSGNSAHAKSMCFKAMQDGLRELRELAPPEESEDAVDEITARRIERERRVAGMANAANLPRS